MPVGGLRGLLRRRITLHDIVHEASVGQKMGSAKRGFSPEYPVSLMMHWRKGGHGGVWEARSSGAFSSGQRPEFLWYGRIFNCRVALMFVESH